MSTAKKVYRTFQASDGRAKLATLSGIGLLLIATLVLALGVFPASAGAGGASEAGVQPTQVNYGGGSGACSASLPGLPSDAGFELHINNPADATYTAANGVQVKLTGISESGDKLFNYEFLTDGWGAYDVVVNGGSKNTLFNNDAQIGILESDSALHAPTRGKNGPLYSLSHINICFDVIPEAPITGTVYEDNTNADGTFDTPEEVGVAELTVYALDATGSAVAGSDETDGDGYYELLLTPGVDYLICLGTPPPSADGDDYVQTEPDTANCETVTTPDVLPLGYDIALTAEGSIGNDFGIIEEFCGEILPADGGVFVASFNILEGGNSETDCVAKSGAAFLSGDELAFPVVGSGSFVARGDISKTFDDPTAVEPLEYRQGDDDLTPSPDGFEDVPWCNLRAFATGDGMEFNEEVPGGLGGQYPTLHGVIDRDSSTPSDPVPAVACLVEKTETLQQTAGGATKVMQENVVLIADDPFYR